MSVRAKFKLDRYESTLHRTASKDANGNWTQSDPIEMRTLILSPVYGNGDPEHENTKFWQASPSGEIRLGTINQDAWAQFELGAEYYVTFDKA